MSAKLIAISLFGVVLMAALSPTLLITHNGVQNPRQVFLIDHGTHTSLAIETRNQTLIRFAYGDKNYYAKRDTSLASGGNALLIPTPAVLARGELEAIAEVESIIDALPVVVQKVYQLQVEASRAEELISDLDEIYLKAGDELIEVPAYGLNFAPHPENYYWANNSSTMIASWMRQMGIRTVGLGAIASWRLLN